ncbi:MAG: chemotaxis protein CheW [Thalassolituus sp.]|uniref:Chemotaxis protein CheW n=2 Tax=root TaxID=1 RepID=M5DUI3_9GAMM|nr:chemotaxis protein CheW [Thalassolituus oleivorans]PCI50805.1 MAG: chemotaxis protein CheW [Oceanospirillales bacterium]PHQ86962.1 MAG: chemotaxis protein CheW [Thalassobium sp.]APR66481.1 chemotaxis protein CheW [Thalassolituus oleivorans]MDF1641590.1 chemotaxis protein CheW [Thalassolituus oleivorans]CCU72908.1 Purine-binding chemotaxis protein cheW [Thalassolituus oleivorans MIL-1]
MEAVAEKNQRDLVGQHEQQYLTFIMSGEEYGVDILAVQEIRGWEESTTIPNAPPYIRGVINLRGTIVPIMDLRARFGLPEVDYSPVTVVIILKFEGANGDRVMGIVVDAVSDVYTIADSDTRKPPELTEDQNSDFIKGLVNVNDKMVILLDVDILLNIKAKKSIQDVVE